MNKAKEWWNELSYEENKNMERKYGLYGHDIGTTWEEILDMYKSEFRTIIEREKKLERILN